MDFSPLLSEDILDKTQVAYTDSLRINNDPGTVLLRAYIGASEGRQAVPVESAISLAKGYYAKRGITIISEIYHNDLIKNNLHWNPQDFGTKLLEADVHLAHAPLHEGNISKTPNWNIANIHATVDRLKHHCGSPMGRYVCCPGLRGDKYRIYDILGEEYCLPTLKIDLPQQSWTPGTFTLIGDIQIDRLVILTK